jgi:uncharacterized iron-regulated membrane protein
VHLLLLVSIVTGLILWWPLTSQRRQAFAIRFPTNPVRFMFDVHKTFSLYTCLVLGAVLLSGVSMNLNKPFVRVTQWFSPTTRDVPGRLVVRCLAAGRSPIGAVERLCALPRAGMRAGTTVRDLSSVDADRRLPRQSPPCAGPECGSGSERWVAIDQYSGAVLDGPRA